MNLETIEMEAGEARQALRDYRAAVKDHALRSRGQADRELAEIDAAVMRGYRELARGRRLLKLSETLAAAGTVQAEVRGFEWAGKVRREVAGMVLAPALAVCRADARNCWILSLVPSRHGFTFRAEDSARKRDRVDVAGGVFAIEDEYARHELPLPSVSLRHRSLRAIVPVVPPPLRPSRGLGNYHVLWEAEWAQGTPPAPRDPALLKHLGGDLWAILAVWDLTELERAVLTTWPPPPSDRS